MNELPENCFDCELYQDMMMIEMCGGNGRIFDLKDDPMNKRPRWCPLGPEEKENEGE